MERVEEADRLHTIEQAFVGVLGDYNSLRCLPITMGNLTWLIEEIKTLRKSNMKRVEEAQILCEYVKRHPRISFERLAELIVKEYPYINSEDLILRLARLNYNYYHAANCNSASTSNQSG